MKFITYLKQIQKNTGLSQNKFAASAGVSPTVISKIYNGKRKPSAMFIVKICRDVGQPEKAIDFIAEL